MAGLAVVCGSASAVAPVAPTIVCPGSSHAIGTHGSWVSIGYDFYEPGKSQYDSSWRPPSSKRHPFLELRLHHALENGRIGKVIEIEVLGTSIHGRGVLGGWIDMKIDGGQTWREPWRAERILPLGSGRWMVLGRVVFARRDREPAAFQAERFADLENAHVIELFGVARDGTRFAHSRFDLTDTKLRDELFSSLIADGALEPCKPEPAVAATPSAH